MIKVAPSILAANFNELYNEVKSVESADYLHIYVMDGHFVPNISLGACVYKNLKGKVDLVFDVHLMISDPKKYAMDFIKAGADLLTFHFEALKTKDEISELIDLIHKNNTKVGISIKSGRSKINISFETVYNLIFDLNECLCNININIDPYVLIEIV